MPQGRSVRHSTRLAQTAPSPNVARDATRVERAAQYQAGAAREAARAERETQNQTAEANSAADAVIDAVIMT